MPSSPRPPLFGPHALLIDADDTVNGAVAECVARNGLRLVQIAPTVDHAKLSEHGRPAIVLIRCPATPAEATFVAKAIRRLEMSQGLDDVPIVALAQSAHLSEPLVHACLAAGICDVIEVPFDKVTLHEVVARCLSVAEGAAKSESFENFVQDFNAACEEEQMAEDSNLPTRH